MRRSIYLFCLATTLSACATDNQAPTIAQERPEVVTGSNIPRRDRSNTGVGIMTREEFERAQSASGVVGGGVGIGGANPK